MSKTRLNISIDQDLADFAKVYARENRVTVSDIVTQYFLAIKRRTNGETTEILMSDPAFREAMNEVRSKLQNGTARWYTFDDVFGD